MGLGDKIMQAYHKLGEKGPSMYKMAKSALHGFNTLGSKVSDVVHHPIVETGLSFIPGPVGVGLKTGIALGDKVLASSKNFEKRLDEGEKLYNTVKETSNMAKNMLEKMPASRPELTMSAKVPAPEVKMPMMVKITDDRIPKTVLSGMKKPSPDLVAMRQRMKMN